MERYEAPVAEVVAFSVQDIVTTSAEPVNCPADVVDNTPVTYDAY